MFLCRFSWLCEPLFRIPRNLGTRNAYGGCRSPPYAAVFLQVSLILFQAVAACVTKSWFCHIRRRLARRLMANVATPPTTRSGFCGQAVRSAPAAALAVHGGTVPPPSLSLRTTPPAPPLRALAGRLNKTRFLSPQPAFLRRGCGVGSLAPLAPCAACGGTFSPPAAAQK